MKKILTTLVVLLLVVVLCACKSSNSSINNDSTTDSIQAAEELTMAIPQCDYHPTFHLGSYDEMVEAFDNAEFYKDLYEEERYGKSFKNLCDSMKSGQLELMVPAYKGEIVTIKALNDNKVVLFSQEKFNLPWIWYYCEIEGHNIVLEVCYLDVFDAPHIADEMSYSEISNLLAPLYPTANNSADKSSYKSITEKDLELNNFGKTQATIFDYNEDENRINYRFRYDNMLVSIWNWGNDNDEYAYINDDFVSNVSFVKYEK